LDGEIAGKFFEAVVGQARSAGLLSDEHFTVDGTLIEAWASHKSFKPMDDQEPPAGPTGSNPTINFKGTKRSNDTHRSTTDSDARLFRKSSNTGAQLGYLGHALLEHRTGLAVDGRLTLASGTAEREAALAMIDGVCGSRRITLGADKGYDTTDFLAELHARNVTPHDAQNNTRRRSAVDERTTRHEGYAIGQRKRKRKRVEEIFGWEKVIGGVRKTRFEEWLVSVPSSPFPSRRSTSLRMRKLIPIAT
jgi:hypothetical protein